MALCIKKDKECVVVGLIFNPLYSDIYGRYDFASKQRDKNAFVADLYNIPYHYFNMMMH